MLSPMAASARFLPATSAPAHPSDRLLPTGACNFRNLEAAHEVPICGCQSFWLDELPKENQSSHLRARFVCACGHHACFHQTGPGQADLSLLNDAGPDTFPPVESEQHYQSGTYALDMFGHHRNRWPLHSHGLPSTAPHSAVSCKPLETTNGPKMQSDQLNTRISLPNLMGYAHVPEDLIASATEVNTPSDRGSPRITRRISPPRYSSMPFQVSGGETPPNVPTRSKHVLRNDNAAQTPSSGPVEDVEPRNTSAPLVSDLRNIIESYAYRLDVLENSSFSHVPAEEIQEKFELVEARLLELESFKADASAMCDADDIDHSQSTNSDMEAQPGISQLMSEVEERLSILESSYPSYAHPWEIDVVLLPWGSNLNGIWMTPSDALRSPRSEDCHKSSNNPDSQMALDSSPNASLLTDWIPSWPSMNEARLTPKAPGPNSAVFRRLRSRGLVHKVTFTECGASHIWTTIFNTFYQFLVQNAGRSSRMNPAPPEYHGLAQPLIPLRKQRKSPHLKFLAPHELITPATWDFNFLKSGILMKTRGTYRLYITTSESYVQSDSGQWSWSWLRICGLPRIRSSLGSVRGNPSQPVCIEGSEEELCWDHHPTLDKLPSFDQSSSFSSQGDHPGRRRSKSPNGENRQRPIPTTSSPSGSVTPVPFTASRGRSKHTPVAVAAEHRGVTSSSSKRYIASPSGHTGWYQKRRRTSSSLETERRMARLTPRWSREPGSPTTPERKTEMQGSGTPSIRDGADGGAHLAYATPHSNTAVAFYLEAGGDTEPDSNSNSDGEQSYFDSENDWEGMMDDDLVTSCTSHVVHETLGERNGWDGDDTDMADDVDSVSDDSGGNGEDLDEDLDDGLTIYEAQF